MKKVYFLLLLVPIMNIISCKKEVTSSNTIPAVPETGMYISQQYDDAQLTTISNIPYSTRENFNRIQYASDLTIATDTLSDSIVLTMDVVLPPNATANSHLPVIVYIHGGDFYAGTKEGILDEAKTYARAGYVAVSIDYRLTKDNFTDLGLRVKAITSSVDDGMNAIRFLKKNADTYHIDVNRIATIGSSAGGGISMINAIQYDELLTTRSDYPGISSKIQGAISTGATLVETGIDPLQFLVFDSFDTPVLLYHANPEDGYRHTTWTGNVIPTQTLINNSGNECIISPQPDLTHTVDLSLGGAYWNVTKEFLWKKLKLYTL